MNETRQVQDGAISIDESHGLHRSQHERGSVLDAVRAAEAIFDMMLLRVRRALMWQIIRLGSVMREIFVELDGRVGGANGRPDKVTEEIG